MRQPVRAVESVLAWQSPNSHEPVYLPGHAPSKRGGANVSTTHESFWDHASFAFVGSSGTKGFPKLSYGAAKERGKKVFAVDGTVEEIEGDRAFPDFEALPEPVDAAVLEVPREETADWVGRAADAGIREVWIHMNRDTPEALAVADERGVTLHTGSCAVMYLTSGFNVHGLHRWIEKLRGRY